MMFNNFTNNKDKIFKTEVKNIFNFIKIYTTCQILITLQNLYFIIKYLLFNIIIVLFNMNFILTIFIS
jgi:hypothetical protein